jgi:hypothetical protein
MKKANGLRPEYRRADLGKGVRGKYYREYMKGTNLVLLRPEVAQAFPTSEAVNDALQGLIEVASRSASLTARTRRKRRAGSARTGRRTR